MNDKISPWGSAADIGLLGTDCFAAVLSMSVALTMLMDTRWLCSYELYFQKDRLEHKVMFSLAVIGMSSGLEV